MAGIENLRNRIIKDSEDKAQEIEKAAKAKADEILTQAEKKGSEILEDMKSKAERHGKDRKERLISKAQLDARNDVLSAKQEAIDKVLRLAVERVSHMNDRDYNDFIEKLLINSIETGEEEIILSETDKSRIQPSLITTVNDKLNSQGKRGMVRISSETRSISGGFILKRGGLEINCSIESQIRIIRDSLEGEIANLLFEGR